MIGMDQDLARRAQAGQPVRFAIVGAGQMGVDMVSQVHQMKGMEVVAVADLELERARQAYAIAGFPEGKIVTATSAAAANDAVRAGKWIVTDRPEWIPQLEAVESVVELPPDIRKPGAHRPGLLQP